MSDVNCYIDEAGDEGIETGGSKWFILGALIIPAAGDVHTSSAVTRIKHAWGKDGEWVLHWSKIKKHNQKLFVCQELLTEEWTFSAVATDKTHPSITQAPGLKQKYALYFYSARLLLERLSWWTRDHGYSRALPIFEQRSNISYDEMKDYFRLLRGWMPPTQISWPHVEYKQFIIRPKRLSRLLQATDCVCGALREGLEYSGYGFTEPRYIQSLGSRFYRRGGNLFSYGLKFLHGTPGIHTVLRNEYPWLKTI